MRYCMSFYLNWHRNQEGSKLKATYLLNKKLTFNFNHSQFLCQLRQKFIQYLILKLQSMVKWSQEGQSMHAFQYCKILGHKWVIYFINRVIVILIFESGKHFQLLGQIFTPGMSFYLNWHRNQEWLKLNVSCLLSK